MWPATHGWARRCCRLRGCCCLRACCRLQECGRPRRYCRQRGCCRFSARRLLPLFLLVLLLGSCAVQSSKRFLRSSGPRHSTSKIVGSVILPVKVYVKLNHNSPCILCLTNHLQNLELINPSSSGMGQVVVFLQVFFDSCQQDGQADYYCLRSTYPYSYCLRAFRVRKGLINCHQVTHIKQLLGPSFFCLLENGSVQISPTGALTLRHFNLSGLYTCVVYKLTAMQPDKKHIIKYLICAYADPPKYYEFTAQYHAAPCNSFLNACFEEALLEILKELMAKVSCEVTLIKSECHHIKMKRGGLENEIFFTFSVASLDREIHNRRCQQSARDASRRLNKAKYLIERFFEKQVESLRERPELLPEIPYIEGILRTVAVHGCYPGYGVNALTHPGCPECCDFHGSAAEFNILGYRIVSTVVAGTRFCNPVIRSPGAYNSSDGIHCLQCDNSSIYGATKC